MTQKIYNTALKSNDRILTGDRPTGPLHLGHLVGSLQPRVELQRHCPQTVLIADLQALTDNGHQPQMVADNVLNVVADYLAVGIDPGRTTIALQSAIPALSELPMYYSNLVTVGRLSRNPTVKSEIRQKGLSESLPVGFFTYPISQAADITAFQATLVPVGEDQIPMLEQTNEIVRRINSITGEELLTECRPLLSHMPRLPGTGGQAKMSKTLGNAISLGAKPDLIQKAVESMYTDPGHVQVNDPGQVEGNVVFTYLDVFHPDKSEVDELKAHYRRGGLGDRKTKRILNDVLQELLTPIRERREQLLSDRTYLIEVLQEGSMRARIETNITLQRIKASFGLDLLGELQLTQH